MEGAGWREGERLVFNVKSGRDRQTDRDEQSDRQREKDRRRVLMMFNAQSGVSHPEYSCTDDLLDGPTGRRQHQERKTSLLS